MKIIHYIILIVFLLLVPLQTTPPTSPLAIITFCPTPNTTITPLPTITISPITEEVTTTPVPSLTIVNKNKIYLTFDDGYNQNSVKSILDTLEKYNIKCTFFIIGKNLNNPGYPELWQRAIRNGHEICYHTMTHENITILTNEQIKNDINQWNIAAQKALGQDYIIKKYARLPGGNGTFDLRIKNLFNNLGYTLFYWDDDTYSTVIKYHLNDPVPAISSLISQHIIANAKNNSIILLHFNKYDAPATSQIISQLSEKYQFLTLTDYPGKT